VVLALDLAPVPMVLAVAVLQVATEWLIGRNYALALLFITPMAMLMGQIAAPRPMGSLLYDRAVETVIGAVIGLLIILVGVLLRRRAEGRIAADAELGRRLLTALPGSSFTGRAVCSLDTAASECPSSDCSPSRWREHRPARRRPGWPPRGLRRSVHRGTSS
jgi:hypothetical protein